MLEQHYAHGQRRLFSGNSSPAIYQRTFPWLACDRIIVALPFRNETASEREVLGFSAPLNVITRPQMLRSVPRRRPVNFLDNPSVTETSGLSCPKIAKNIKYIIAGNTQEDNSSMTCRKIKQRKTTKVSSNLTQVKQLYRMQHFALDGHLPGYGIFGHET